ncbi:hypothetical protein GQ457_01G016400 [Hibiscus cannabinus]
MFFGDRRRRGYGSLTTTDVLLLWSYVVVSWEIDVRRFSKHHRSGRICLKETAIVQASTRYVLDFKSV